MVLASLPQGVTVAGAGGCLMYDAFWARVGARTQRTPSVRFYARKEHARSLFRCVYLPLAVQAMILMGICG